MNINGTLISTPLNTYIHEVAAFQFGEDVRTQTVFPSMSDFCQQYNSMTGTGAGNLNRFYNDNGILDTNFQPPINYDNKQNPFLGYANGNNDTTRGSFNFESITSAVDPNDATTMITTVQLQLTESIIISPLTPLSNNEMAFVQISDFDLNIYWDSRKLERILSINKAIIDSGGSVPVGAFVPGSGKIIKIDAIVGGIGLNVGTSQLQICIISQQDTLPIVPLDTPMPILEFTHQI